MNKSQKILEYAHAVPRHCLPLLIIAVHLVARPGKPVGALGVDHGVDGGHGVARAALAMGLSNKCFDPLEREIVGDVLASRVPENWDAAEIFA